VANPLKLSLILHSGAYDRVHHGLSIALSVLSLGGEARLLFTYWALPYVQKGSGTSAEVLHDGSVQQRILRQRLDEGHLRPIPDLIEDAVELGGEMYACVGSMALLNIAREELVDEIKGSTGTASFMKGTENGHLLFI